jgi:hypothetical protein
MFIGRLPVSRQGSVMNRYQDLTSALPPATIAADLREIPTKTVNFFGDPI